MVERRVEAVSIEGDTMYHLDEVVDVETLAVDDDQEEEEDLKPGAIPDALQAYNQVCQGLAHQDQG